MSKLTCACGHAFSRSHANTDERLKCPSCGRTWKLTRKAGPGSPSRSEGGSKPAISDEEIASILDADAPRRSQSSSLARSTSSVVKDHHYVPVEAQSPINIATGEGMQSGGESAEGEKPFWRKWGIALGGAVVSVALVAAMMLYFSGALSSDSRTLPDMVLIGASPATGDSGVDPPSDDVEGTGTAGNGKLPGKRSDAKAAQADLPAVPFTLVPGKVVLPDYSVRMAKLHVQPILKDTPVEETRFAYTRSMKLAPSEDAEWLFEVRPKQSTHLRFEVAGTLPKMIIRWVDQAYEVLDRNGMVLFSYPVKEDIGKRRSPLVDLPFELVHGQPLPFAAALSGMEFREGVHVYADEIKPIGLPYKILPRATRKLYLRFSGPMTLGGPQPAILWQDQFYKIVDDEGNVVFTF